MTARITTREDHQVSEYVDRLNIYQSEILHWAGVAKEFNAMSDRDIRAAIILATADGVPYEHLRAHFGLADAPSFPATTGHASAYLKGARVRSRSFTHPAGPQPTGPNTPTARPSPRPRSTTTRSSRHECP